MKVFLLISLFCSVALADGDMGGGGKTCTQNCGLANVENTTRVDKSITLDLIVFNIRQVLKTIF